MSFFTLRKSRIALGKSTVPGLFGKNRHRCAGVDITAQAIKIVELSRSQGEFRLQAYAIEPLPAGLMNDLTCSGAESVIRVLLKALEKAGVMARDAVVAMPDELLISKTLEVESGLSEADLELHVRLEAEQYVPYALEDVALDFEVQGRSSNHAGQVAVQMVACRQEALEWYRSVLIGAGLTPRVVEVQAHALARGVEAAVPDLSQQEAVAVVDFGSHMTLLSIVRQGQVIYSRELLFGQGMAGAQGFEESVVQHLGLGLEQFVESGAAGVVGMILLAGAAATTPGLSQWVEARLGTPVRVANPFSAMDLNPALTPETLLCDAPMLLTACGLALRGSD